MINGKDHHIVDLIVHESLHATVWVSGSVDFNEKLANFVGLEGSVRYVKRESGDAGVAAVRAEVQGEKVFADFMKNTVDRYKSSVKTMADKEAFYRELSGRYTAFVEARRRTGVQFTPVNAKLDNWNNAALLAYANYYSDYSVLEKMLARCEGNLGRFVAWIAAVQKKKDPAFEAGPEEYLAKIAGGICP